MVTTKPIRPTFADEHVIGIDPPLKPDLPDVWKRRINPFAGRSLSDKALTAEQDLRSGMQRLFGLSLTAGTIEGLEVRGDVGAVGSLPAKAVIQIAPGAGLARSGEDISIGSAVTLPLGDLPVILRADHANALAGPSVPSPGAVGSGISTTDPSVEGLAARLRPALPRRFGQKLTDIAKNPESALLPHVAILLAQPVVAEILGSAADPCGIDPRDDPYVDLQRIDGCRLSLYLWPSEMTALDGGPDYALPVADAARRNRLAYAVFDNEKLFVEGDAHPWEEWGVPLALIGFDADWKLAFIDRAAVARIGGAPQGRTPMVPLSGQPQLWQARIDQLVGHLAELPALDAATLQQSLVRMPPVGLLPPDMFDTVLRRQHFFPGSFTVSATPIPLSNLNLVAAETAGLSSLDRSQPDKVELLVPVPDTLYDPDLLQTEAVDPRFAKAIAEFRKDRSTWLTRREMARRRYDRLMETVSGIVMGWPAADLPIEENSPLPRVQVPVEVTRTRRIAAGNGKVAHRMTGAHATLQISASDSIWLWLRIQDRKALTGLSLRLGSGTHGSGDALTKAVYWGKPDGLGTDLNDQNRIGDLPGDPAWVRLEIPASRIWDGQLTGLDGFAINAVEFGQNGGDVEWASFGKFDASGNSFTYIADDAPAGAALVADGLESGWPWTVVDGRDTMDVPDFGTILKNDVRRASALDGFRDEWNQDFLTADMAAIDEDGIGAFLANVEARLKATNDAIDLGFVRARTDIYRVRQIMLGADAASRLVTSPSLADLAIRDEGARATSKGISEFLTAAVTRTPDASVIKVVGTAPVNSTGGTSGGGTSGGGTIGTIGFRPQIMTLNIASFASAITVPAPSPITPVLSATRAITPLAALTTLQPGFIAQPVATTIRPAVLSTTVAQTTSLNVARLALDQFRYNATDVRAQLPIAGLVERTVSVAERLTPPPAVQALTYALASKAAIIQTLIGLAPRDASRALGIALDDIKLPGFQLPGGGVPTLAQMIDDRTPKGTTPAKNAITDVDQMPGDQPGVATAPGKHEADYFAAAVQAIDNSIAIMRLVEGRVALFERLQQSLTDLKDGLIAQANAVATYLRSVDVEVEEARHDLGTAERLRDEEQVRVDAVNARRAGILADHVTAIAWRRVREVDTLQRAPVIETASGLAESAIVTCRREHEEAPDEIHDYVDLLREVPVRWFPAVSLLVERIERLDSAQAAIRLMAERAFTPRTLPILQLTQNAPRFLLGVQNAMTTQRSLVEARRIEVTQLNFAALPTLSLTQAHVQIRALSTLGDLISGAHRQPLLTRAASAEMDGIVTIAGCLHEAFCDVAPIIRLGWAEILSEFDRPAPLRTLAGLPGWAEVPPEDRRVLQGFVDWLFGRIDADIPAAVDAINELVRICLLMAAQAPVDKLIPAHLVAPAPARIGTRLQLALDISRVRKGMLAVVRDQNNAVVSRAQVDDIADGFAHATITHLVGTMTTIATTMRVELIGGPG